MRSPNFTFLWGKFSLITDNLTLFCALFCKITTSIWNICIFCSRSWCFFCTAAVAAQCRWWILRWSSSSTWYSHTGTMVLFLSFWDPLLTNQPEECLHFIAWPRPCEMQSVRPEMCGNITVPGVQDVLVMNLFEWSEVFSVHNSVSLSLL